MLRKKLLCLTNLLALKKTEMPNLTAVITLNRSARIRVKSALVGADTFTNQNSYEGMDTLTFDYIPDGFIVGAYVNDYTTDNISIGTTIISIDTENNIVTLSDPIVGDIWAGSEIKTAKLSDNGDFINLSPNIVQWIDVNDAYNVRALSHHDSIGQYLTIGSWEVGNEWFPHVPPFVDLNFDNWYIIIQPLNREVSFRLFGWAHVTGEGFSYDFHDARADRPVEVNLGDPDWLYNRKQLNKHRSIGQYIQGWAQWTDDARVGIKSISRSSKVRAFDVNGNYVQLPPIQHDTPASNINPVWVQTFVIDELPGWVDNPDANLIKQTHKARNQLNRHTTIGQYIVTHFDYTQLQ